MTDHDRSQIDIFSGVLPPLTMPFDEKGTLVPAGLKEQIDFVIDAGAGGVVVGGSTGEGHTLSREEFLLAMTVACDAVAGRVPLLAGLIVNSTLEAIDRARMLKGLKVHALQVTPVHYLFKPDADATVEHFNAISRGTGLPIIIYNVIPWNYLDVGLMLRIMDEVPGVIGIKQSSGDLKSISDLLLRCDRKNIVLTGVDALLYPAFSLGVHGAISALTAAVPSVIVKLWNATKAGDHDQARKLHFKLNGLWNALRHDNLPACVKYTQYKQGLALYCPRAPMEHVTDAQKSAIDRAFAGLM